MNKADWQPLEEELQRWQERGLPVRFWLRDDDAIAPTEKLDQLARLTQIYHVPVCLAVIPADLSAALGQWIKQYELWLAAVHGFSHRNHAGPDEKKFELGLHRPIDTVLAELAGGRKIVETVFADQFFNALVPPWNRIDPKIAERASEAGFDFLSTFGWKTLIDKNYPLAQFNSHIDIMDWRGSRGGKSDEILVRETVSALQTARDANGAAVGLLSHHLVHDERAWEFLDRLFKFTTGRDHITWESIKEIAAINAK